MSATLLGTVATATLWRVALDPDPEELARAWTLLSGDERARAEGLRLADVRRRFVTGRAGLREVLARHRGEGAQTLRFRVGCWGKPALEGGPAFSFSHSGELALCAVSQVGEIGVDLEQVRPVPDAAALAERWLGERERARFRACGGDELFLRLWTRREALVKAIGTGIAAIEDGSVDAERDRWDVHELAPADGYVGALALTRRRTARPAAEWVSAHDGSAT